jgi:hypothetical protein
VALPAVSRRKVIKALTKTGFKVAGRKAVDSAGNTWAVMFVCGVGFWSLDAANIRFGAPDSD